MQLPGCPDREIVSVEPARGGHYIRLSCNHAKYVAGPLPRFMKLTACLQYPCYKPVRDMSDY